MLSRAGSAALPRIAARFTLAYPEVQLEIVAKDCKVDPVKDGYDLIIRIDPSPDERLVGRRFLNDERLIVAPPGMPRPSSRVDGDEATVKAVLLSATPPGTVWRMKSGTDADIVFRPDPVLRLSLLLMVRDAVLAGAGAAVLPKTLKLAGLPIGERRRIPPWRSRRCRVLAG